MRRRSIGATVEVWDGVLTNSSWHVPVPNLAPVSGGAPPGIGIGQMCGIVVVPLVEVQAIAPPAGLGHALGLQGARQLRHLHVGAVGNFALLGSTTPEGNVLSNTLADGKLASPPAS